MKIRNEVKFGILAILGIVAFVVGMSYMQGKRLFGNNLVLYAKYENVAGLTRGNPVVMNGLAVGKVTSLELDDGQVMVTLDFSRFREIPTDSRAEIYSADFLGSKAVRIVMGESSEMLEDESVINGTNEEGIVDKATEILDDRGDEILRNVDDISTNLVSLSRRLDSLVATLQSNGNYERILSNVDASLSNLQITTASLSRTMPAVESFATTLEARSGDVGTTLSNFRQLSDSLRDVGGELNGLLASAEGAVVNVRDLVAKLESRDGSLGMLVNDRNLYDNLNGTVDNLQSLVDAIRANPREYLDVDVYLFERRKKYIDAETGEVIR